VCAVRADDDDDARAFDSNFADTHRWRKFIRARTRRWRKFKRAKKARRRLMPGCARADGATTRETATRRAARHGVLEVSIQRSRMRAVRARFRLQQRGEDGG